MDSNEDERKNSSNIYDTNRQPVKTEDISQDVIERVQSDRALKKSEARYKALYADLQRQAQDLKLLNKVRTALASEMDLPLLLQTIVEAIVDTFGYTPVSIYLLQDDMLTIQHQVGYPQGIQEIPITQGVIGQAVRSGKPILLKDVHTNPAFLAAIDGIISEICIPLCHQNKVVGALNVESSSVALDEVDLNLMIALSEHINIAIGRARLYAEVRKSEEKHRMLFETIAQGILYQAANGQIISANPAAERILGLRLEQMQNHTLCHFYAGNAIHEDGSNFPSETYPCRVTLKTGLPIYSVIMGVFHAYEKKRRWLSIDAIPQFKEGEEKPHQVYTTFQDITERKQAESELQHAATHDPLTNLPNRALFNDRLKFALTKAKRNQEKLAILFVDLDDFKAVNDTYGHETGDQLLIAFSMRLQDFGRKSDTIARLSGDEFSLILESITSKMDVARIAKKIISLCSKPYKLGKDNVLVGLSLGISLYPEGAVDAGTLLNRADAAMYQAKEQGKNNYQFFNQLGSE